MNRRGVFQMTRNPEGGVIDATPRLDIALALPLEVVELGETRVYPIRLPFLPPTRNHFVGMPGEFQHSIQTKWVRAIRREVDALDVPRRLVEVGVAAKLVFATRPVGGRKTAPYETMLWEFVREALCRAEVVVDDNPGRVIVSPGGCLVGYDTRALETKRRQHTHLVLTCLIS